MVERTEIFCVTLGLRTKVETIVQIKNFPKIGWTPLPLICEFSIPLGVERLAHYWVGVGHGTRCSELD